MEERISVTGIETVTKEFKSLVAKYPDRAGELLRMQGVAIRKEVIKNVKESVGTIHSKKSLSKAGSYRVSQPKGLGIRQTVEISAQSPHFHLVEHGHELIVNGENRGFVPGKHMMADAVKKREKEMPAAVDAMLGELLKEGGFL